MLPLSGRSVALYDGERIPLSPGDLFIVWPNRVHGYSDSQNGLYYVMFIPASPYLAAYRGALEQKVPASPLLRCGTWEHTGVRQLLDMAFRDRKEAPEPVLWGYLLLIVGKLMPLLMLRDAPSERAGALQSVLRFLNEHYTEPLSRQDIAAAVGYDESYISHIFSDTLHTTLTDYVASLRVDDASQLLADSDLPVNQIAMVLGFGSIRSFNRAFLSRAGVSPSAYRAAARSGESLPAWLPS